MLSTQGQLRFHGNLDRLHRTVKRYGGHFQSNHEFTVRWIGKRAKPLDKLSFDFRCSCRHIRNGYIIDFQIRPSCATILRTVLPLLITAGIAYQALMQNIIPIIPCLIFLSFVPFIIYITQYRNCLREFLSCFDMDSNAPGNE